MGPLAVPALALALSWAAGCETSTLPVDADAEVRECTSEPVEVACPYFGYGAECRVACSYPADCRFTVHVDWGPHHCCSFEDSFGDCRCVGGTSLCRGWGASPYAERQVPTAYCEFCGWGVDAGVDASLDRDAGVRDASDDAASDASGAVGVSDAGAM